MAKKEKVETVETTEVKEKKVKTPEEKAEELKSTFDKPKDKSKVQKFKEGKINGVTSWKWVVTE